MRFLAPGGCVADDVIFPFQLGIYIVVRLKGGRWLNGLGWLSTGAGPLYSADNRRFAIYISANIARWPVIIRYPLGFFLFWATVNLLFICVSLSLSLEEKSIPVVFLFFFCLLFLSTEKKKYLFMYRRCCVGPNESRRAGRRYSPCLDEWKENGRMWGKVGWRRIERKRKETGFLLLYFFGV